MIFDTHVHYDDAAFDEDRDSVIEGLPAAGIGAVVNAACDVESSEFAIALAEKYDFIHAMVGVHPQDAENMGPERRARIEELLKTPGLAALGEIGLDYHYPDTDKAAQKDVFEWQLDLAHKFDLPIAIHSRDAAADTLDIMKAEASDLGGVIHCFSYSKEMAREYLDMGYYLGIGGVLTYKNAKKLVEVVAYAPMDRLVLETDGPYLSPVPLRGTRNSSYNLPYVVRTIAGIKGLSEAEVEDITWANAHRLYRMDMA